MFSHKQARHWLAVQWSLWNYDQRIGRLYGRGFRRWATYRDGTVRPARGDAGGSHWQLGCLRILSWGCWLEEDGEALAYWGRLDRLVRCDRWLMHPEVILGLPPAAESALQAFEACAAEYEAHSGRERLQLVSSWCEAGWIHPEAARNWFLKVGLQPQRLW